MVDSINNADTEIILEEARELQPKIKVGEIIETEVTPPKDFGRIAAQTANRWLFSAFARPNAIGI